MLVWSLTARMWFELLKKALKVILILTSTGHHTQRRLPSRPPGDHLCTHLSRRQADKSAGPRVKVVT